MRYQAKSNVEKVIDGIKNRNALATVKTTQVISQNNAQKYINSIYFKKNLNLIQKADKARGNGRNDSKLNDHEKSKVNAADLTAADAYEDEIAPSRNKSHNQAMTSYVNATLQPKNLLPQLHEKTFFKAAMEYSLGEKVKTKALNDTEGSI